MRKVFFLGGILSNYRGLLPGAMAAGQARGFQTGILDVVNLVPRWKPYPNPWKQLGLVDRVTVFADDAELRRFAATAGTPDRPMARRDIVIFLHPPGPEIRWIWDLLQFAGLAVGVMTINPVPTIHALRGWRQGVEAFLKRPLRRLKAVTKPVPAYWIISGAGTLDCYRSYFRHLRGTRIIKAHSADFEAFQAVADGQERKTGETIVFLDQGWHTKLRGNFRADGRYPPTGEDVYRRSVVAWLTSLQAASGLRVVIAAHPKGNIERVREVYQGIEVSSQPTALLVRNASIVIGNCTTSLQFAVMANKPICLFTSDELDQSLMLPGLLGYQRALNAPVVNIDHPPDSRELLDSLRVDPARYLAFLHEYIVHRDSGNGTLWDKVFLQLTDTRESA